MEAKEPPRAPRPPAQAIPTGAIGVGEPARLRGPQTEVALDAEPSATRPVVATPGTPLLGHLMDALPSGWPMGLTKRKPATLVPVPSRPTSVDLQEAVAPVPPVVAEEAKDATREPGAATAVGEAARTEVRASTPATKAVAAAATARRAGHLSAVGVSPSCGTVHAARNHRGSS